MFFRKVMLTKILEFCRAMDHDLLAPRYGPVNTLIHNQQKKDNAQRQQRRTETTKTYGDNDDVRRQR